jgi:signal transduction histidine kinase
MNSLCSPFRFVTGLFDRLRSAAARPSAAPDRAGVALCLQSHPAGQRNEHFGHARPREPLPDPDQLPEEPPAMPKPPLDVLYDAAFDGFVVADDQGVVLDANLATCALFALSREQLRGRRLADLFDQGGGGLCASVPFFDQVGGPGPFTLRPADGTARVVECRVVALDPPGVRLLVLHDVTRLTALQKQYGESQKLEAIGRMTLGVAHDLNNMLTVIDGWAAFLLHGPGATDPTRPMIHEIAKASERATALTRQLLAFGRGAGPALVAIDVNALLLDMHQMLRRLVGDAIDLRVVTAPDAWHVQGDPGQLGQVLMNLVVNARDAMPGGGSLTVETKNVELDEAYCRAHHEARPGEYVRLTVSDSGCGMDAALQARIFEPFFTTKGLGKGMGLGLSTVIDIVRRAGGHVTVQSLVDVGTTFEVYLPRVRQGEAAATEPASPAELSRGTETVLIVEGDDAVRAFVGQILRGCGYTALEARDGAEAVVLSERHPGPIDLLVADVALPRLSGPQVADLLASARRKLKVLYLSGRAGETMIPHDTPGAAALLLKKPFTASALTRKVREVLDVERPAD